MIPPCLTLSNIRYVLRVKWSNTGKGVARSPPTPRCSSYWKGGLLVALDYGRQHIHIYLWTRLHPWHFSFHHEIVNIVCLWFKLFFFLNGNSIIATQQIFNKNFKTIEHWRVPDRKIIFLWVGNFRDTGSVLKRKYPCNVLRILQQWSRLLPDLYSKKTSILMI